MATVFINLWALLHNYNCLRSQAAPVLKSDAYGHGLIRCASTLAFFANCPVICCGHTDEGRRMREAGIVWAEIIPLFGCHSSSDFADSSTCHLTTLIHNDTQIEPFIASLRKYSKGRAALKIDLGMSRLGFNPDAALKAVARLADSPSVDLRWIIGHFPADGENPNQTRKAGKTALEVLEATRAYFPDCRLSLGSSAALARKRQPGVWIRPGLAIYGVSPDGLGIVEKYGLIPVLKFGAPVLEVRRLAKGARVSYGGTFQAPREMTVAVVAMGYANGISRSWSGKIALRLNGRVCRQVGAICMNMLMIDATDAEARSGDFAWLIDNDEPDIDIYTGEARNQYNNNPDIIRRLQLINKPEQKVTSNAFYERFNLPDNEQQITEQLTHNIASMQEYRKQSPCDSEESPAKNIDDIEHAADSMLSATEHNIWGYSATDHNQPDCNMEGSGATGSIDQNCTIGGTDATEHSRKADNRHHTDNSGNDIYITDNTKLTVSFLSKQTDTPPWEILATIGLLNPRRTVR